MGTGNNPIPRLSGFSLVVTTGKLPVTFVSISPCLWFHTIDSRHCFGTLHCPDSHYVMQAASLNWVTAHRLHLCISPVLDSSQCKRSFLSHGICIITTHDSSVFSGLANFQSSLCCVTPVSLTDNKGIIPQNWGQGSAKVMHIMSIRSPALWTSHSHNAHTCT